MSDPHAQAVPTGEQIWEWALANSAALAAAVNAAVHADRPREVWAATKDAGDLLIDLFDPERPRAAGADMKGIESIPWDKVVTIVLPILLDWIRKRRAERGA
jgi:hypothetical protein